MKTGAAGTAGELVVSSGQRRLWFMDRLRGRCSTEYNLPVVLRLRGHLNRAALAKALDSIIERHEPLRTRFCDRDGEPVQVVEPRCHTPSIFEDLHGFDRDTQSQHVQEILRQEWNQPFDLGRAPLVRVRLLRLGDDEHILLRNVHHIAFDAASHVVWNRELAALYNAYANGIKAPFRPLPLHYTDYARWQRDQVSGVRMHDGIAYWTRQLQDLPQCHELPTDRMRPPIQTSEGAHHHLRLESPQLEQLTAFSRARKCTLYMTLLTALAVVMARHSGSKDIVVGSPVANRNDERLNELIGFFVNFIVLRLHVPRTVTLRALLEHVQATVFDAQHYSNVPFESLVERLAPRRRQDASPMFQVLFDFQSIEWNAPQLEALKVSFVPRNHVRVSCDLEVYVKYRDGVLAIEWRYNTALFDCWRIEQMARNYEYVLIALLSDDNRVIGAVPLLDGQEKANLLGRWSSPVLSV